MQPPAKVAALALLLSLLSPQAAAVAAAAAAAIPLQCGVASAVFSTCPACLNTALKTGELKFWWSWGTETELDTAALGPELTEMAQRLFVPMLWGQGNPRSDEFLSSGSQYVMGFNEPDQYGPSCDGDWNPPAYGCADGEWRAASSSGWAPLFDPSIGKPGKANARASRWWQWAVNNMTEPALRPPPPPVPCDMLKTPAACAKATWPPDPNGKIWGRCEWNINHCADRRPPPPPPPPPPAPAPPPSPGPPLPSSCVAYPGSTASGVVIARVCAGLSLFDCCARIPQHNGCEAAVAHNGCCEYLNGTGGARSAKPGSTVILHSSGPIPPTPAPSPPPGPDPPSPGPPLPPWCIAFPGQTAVGTLITKQCGGLKLFDCCERIPQHANCSAAVAADGCCEFLLDAGGSGMPRSPKDGSTLIVHTNVSIEGTSTATIEPPAPPAPAPPSNWTVRKVVSPSMAQGAYLDPNASCIGADPAKQHFCQGWLQVFKNYTLTLPCTDFQGKRTNCWDVIDAIQIHAYARTAAEVMEKIKGYRDVFAEDFEGRNGRKPKTLWLTEVAAGSSDGAFVKGFVHDLLSPTTGLMNRDVYGYVERVSWFSEFSFGSFPVGSYVPAPRESWVSSLFNPYGELSSVGEAFFGLCGGSDRH